jgi:signal transduction histidine kinase
MLVQPAGLGRSTMQMSGLRYFLVVARTGSIAAASAQLNVAASAISRQIANLEAELDCVLFERRPRGMVLSPAGELLARHARQTLVRAEQVAAEIQELQGLARGFIRVATAEGFALDLLPNAIAEFHARHPGIRFEVRHDDATLTLVCDRRQIGQALTNIVKNAVEAIEARGEHWHADCSGERAGAIPELGGGGADAALADDGDRHVPR